MIVYLKKTEKTLLRGHPFLSTLGFSREGRHCEQAPLSPSPCRHASR